MNRPTSDEVINLVKRLPNSNLHIYEYNGLKCITTEWLVGNFAGSSFEVESLDTACDKMIDYLYNHINHDSMVGKSVTESGFPDLEKVERYCKRFEDE